MAVTEDVIRLVLETKGAGSIEDLQQNLEYTRATLGQLKTAYDAGEIATEEFLKTGARLARQERELADTLIAVEQAERQAVIAMKQATAEAERATIAAGKQAGAQDQVADSAGKAGSKVAGFGQSALQAGRVVQDFAQGGLGGILNNIEGLAMALGGGSGLAGVLTLLGVGFMVFKPQITEFLNSFKTEPIKAFQGVVETLEAKIKELTEKPNKLSLDIQQLENAKEQIDAIKKGLAALEAAKSGRTEDEVAAGDKFSKEFAATGAEGRAAMEAVQRQVGDAAVASDPAARAARKALADRERSQQITAQALQEAQAKVEEAKGFGDPDFVRQVANEAALLAKELQDLANPDEMAKLRDNVKQAADDARKKANAEVGNTFADVAKGNNEIARDVMAERFRAAGQDKFAGMVAGASPEAVAAQREADAEVERIEAAFQESVQNVKRRWDKIRAAEKKRLKEAEEAGREAEQSPEFKRIQAEIDRKFKGVGLEDVDRDVVLQRNKKAAEAEAKKAAAANKLDDRPDVEQMNKVRQGRAQENLARQIFQGSAQQTGTQFTPDQSRDVAKATFDAMSQGANFNAALQSALMQEMQAMQAMAARFQQQQAQMQMLANGFGQINRQVRQPGNWNGNPMGGD